MVVCSFYGGDFNVHVVHFIVPGDNCFQCSNAYARQSKWECRGIKVDFFYPYFDSHTVPRYLSSYPIHAHFTRHFFLLQWILNAVNDNYKSNRILQLSHVSLHMLIYHRLLLITLRVAQCMVRASHLSSEGKTNV